jgi:hypothetical protein
MPELQKMVLLLSEIRETIRKKGFHIRENATSEEIRNLLFETESISQKVQKFSSLTVGRMQAD